MGLFVALVWRVAGQCISMMASDISRDWRWPTIIMNRHQLWLRSAMRELIIGWLSCVWQQAQEEPMHWQVSLVVGWTPFRWLYFLDRCAMTGRQEVQVWIFGLWEIKNLISVRLFLVWQSMRRWSLTLCEFVSVWRRHCTWQKVEDQDQVGWTFHSMYREHMWKKMNWLVLTGLTMRLEEMVGEIKIKMSMPFLRMRLAMEKKEKNCLKKWVKKWQEKLLKKFAMPRDLCLMREMEFALPEHIHYFLL